MTNADTDRLVKMISAFKDEIKDEFRHQLGIQAENFQSKLDLVFEGHQMLSEKIDILKTELTQKLETLAAKVDAIAADIKAHRADTEAHHPVYRVKE